MTPFEDDMKKAQKAEEDRVNAEAKQQQKRADDERKAREKEEKRRSQEQVDNGDIPKSQHKAAHETPHLTEADMADGDVRKDKEEVDPQFAGKHAEEKLADLPDTPLSAEDQDRIVEADQEVRAALTAKKQGIPDIPNAEGDDAKVVEGVEKAREAEKKDK